jgi:hypothetical protein
MNTKQVLYNALQSQLETKKQAYNTFNETISQPALVELKDEVKNFLTSFICFDDKTTFEFGTRSLSINFGDDWYNKVEFLLNTTWKGDEAIKYVEVDWNSGAYSLNGKEKGKRTINAIYACVHNLSLVQDKWVNDWHPKQKEIHDNDNAVRKEYEDLQTALNNLSNEIKQDSADAMKKIGFEVKKFKDDIHLDWDYKDDGGRVYNIITRSKSIQMQHGRSQYETTYVHGFKVLGKKGNKYNVEVYREGSPNKTYDVLEKKFESFVSDASRWEFEEADKRAEKTKRDFEERSKK